MAEMNEPYPFGMGNIRLLHVENSAPPPSILLGTRIIGSNSSYFLFGRSKEVKQELETEIAASRCIDDRVHPTSLELRAAVASITFFECVAAQSGDRSDTPKIIEHDNWHRMFWIFLRLFEGNFGFIARWEDRYTYMRDLWEKEPHHSVGELRMTSLDDDSGKSYSTSDGTVLLEYVDKM